MNHNHIASAPVNPGDQYSDEINESADRLRQNHGVSAESAVMISEHIGSEALHELNAPADRLMEINAEVSINVNENMREDTESVRMSREDVDKFLNMAKDDEYEGGPIEVPSSIPKEMHNEYKKVAEALILRGLLGTSDSKAYKSALSEGASVTMMGAYDSTNNSKSSAIQVIRYPRIYGHGIAQVEVIRNYDDDANEVGLRIKAVGKS